ncbi:MAG TPA: hypothetical protein DCZ55_28150 [Cyanobacteria bacterium UBA11371]|nr:hypothetical protein [Cyanobacteria bacterium UBA11371]HBE30292.1 hypothetical protein [Cyanobacteria bacterium UBA11368]
MSVMRRPILIGGIGLSFSLWALESFHHSLDQVDEWGMLGALALGAGFWLFRKQGKIVQLQLDAPPVDREAAEKAIAKVETVISQLEAEAQNHNAIPQLREKVAQLKAELDRKELTLAVTGGKTTGKTTLIHLLAESLVSHLKQSVTIKETPALFTGNGDDTALDVAIASDLVLFVTNGDLTDSEFEFIQQLKAANQRVLLVFNKQDQYLPADREVVLQQLQQRMGGDVVAIAASPKAVKVRQHQEDGSVNEWLEEQTPEITALTAQISQILAQESQQLVIATTWRKAGVLKAEAKGVLNGVRSDRAMPQIEQYQWIAAAAAFANPVPALDLVATGAINAQLVMDLSNIYQQKFSLEQAKTVAGTMGSLMLKLGLVELSSQAITGILKSHAVTFVAGGAVQGVSAAYLTRLAGLSLIEYFQEQEISVEESRSLNVEKLGETLKKVFQENQRTAFLQGFVKQAVARILPESSAQKQLAAEATTA